MVPFGGGLTMTPFETQLLGYAEQIRDLVHVGTVALCLIFGLMFWRMVLLGKNQRSLWSVLLLLGVAGSAEAQVTYNFDPGSVIPIFESPSHADSGSFRLVGNSYTSGSASYVLGGLQPNVPYTFTADMGTDIHGEPFWQGGDSIRFIMGTVDETIRNDYDGATFNSSKIKHVSGTVQADENGEVWASFESTSVGPTHHGTAMPHVKNIVLTEPELEHPVWGYCDDGPRTVTRFKLDGFGEIESSMAFTLDLKSDANPDDVMTVTFVYNGGACVMSGENCTGEQLTESEAVAVLGAALDAGWLNGWAGKGAAECAHQAKNGGNCDRWFQGFNFPIRVNDHLEQFDGCGFGVPCDPMMDADGDGVNDCDDLCPGDAMDLCHSCDEDIDGDGIDNCKDPCPDDFANGCAACDTDTDMDGEPDCLDDDDDDDGWMDGSDPEPLNPDVPSGDPPGRGSICFNRPEGDFDLPDDELRRKYPMCDDDEDGVENALDCWPKDPERTECARTPPDGGGGDPFVPGFGPCDGGFQENLNLLNEVLKAKHIDIVGLTTFQGNAEAYILEIPIPGEGEGRTATWTMSADPAQSQGQYPFHSAVEVLRQTMRTLLGMLATYGFLVRVFRRFQEW